MGNKYITTSPRNSHFLMYFSIYKLYIFIGLKLGVRLLQL